MTRNKNNTNEKEKLIRIGIRTKTIKNKNKKQKLIPPRTRKKKLIKHILQNHSRPSHKAKWNKVKSYFHEMCEDAIIWIGSLCRQPVDATLDWAEYQCRQAGGPASTQQVTDCWRLPSGGPGTYYTSKRWVEDTGQLTFFLPGEYITGNTWLENTWLNSFLENTWLNSS